MIQLNKRWNIKLGSLICLGNLILWSLQAIVQIVWKGGPRDTCPSGGRVRVPYFRYGVRGVHGQGQPDTGVWAGVVRAASPAGRRRCAHHGFAMTA